LERQGFSALIDGSEVSMDEIEQRALTNWYIDADEALRLKLVTQLV
jgi:enoyl-CoA hydratase/carnithine racemase